MIGNLMDIASEPFLESENTVKPVLINHHNKNNCGHYQKVVTLCRLKVMQKTPVNFSLHLESICVKSETLDVFYMVV